MDDAVLLEWTLALGRLLQRFAPFFYGGLNGGGDLVPTCIGKTNVQYRFVVVGRHRLCRLNGLEHIRLDELSSSQNSYTSPIAVKQGTVLSQLYEFDLGHVHQRIHFVLRALKVLDTEGIDRDVCDPGLVAYFKNLEAGVLALISVG